MTRLRLYFSHSYHVDDVALNVHLWLRLSRSFHAWIDSGREAPDPAVAGDSPARFGQVGARRPMDVSFNEWMMSQCDGFLAITPARDSPYQALEYQLAMRMGIPRLVARQAGSIFGALDDELLEIPTDWHELFTDDRQARIDDRIDAFVAEVDEHRRATDMFRSIGRWRRREVVGELRVGLLAPSSDSDWGRLQGRLQRDGPSVDWELLPPRNLKTEHDLLLRDLDVLVVDVGPHGTPREMLGYLHAVGVPQIRVCRLDGNVSADDLGSFLTLSDTRRRRPPFDGRDEVDAPDTPRSLPAIYDGLRVDEGMQPIAFWTHPYDLVPHVLDTVGRIQLFRSRRSPEEGGIALNVSTHETVRAYFAEAIEEAQRGTVFISFAGSGPASGVADRLARILRYRNFRCFHYLDPDNMPAGRLEGGEDVHEGLARRVSESDVAVFLVEEAFVASEYCREELKSGVGLREEARLELVAYTLEGSDAWPDELDNKSLFQFRDVEWDDDSVVERIVADVERVIGHVGWALRDDARRKVERWLDEDDRRSEAGLRTLLHRAMGVDADELEAVLSGVEDGGPLVESIVRLPHGNPDQRARRRELVVLLLLALATDAPGRIRDVAYWLHERRLVRRPVVESATELVVHVESGPLAPVDAADPVAIGQRVADRYPQTVDGSDPICVLASKDFLSTPIEWSRVHAEDVPTALRRRVRWCLTETVDLRTPLFDEVAARPFLPPQVAVLGLEGQGMSAEAQSSAVVDAVRDAYRGLGWPVELVTRNVDSTAADLLTGLRGGRAQIVHLAGHMGPTGLSVGDDVVDVGALTEAINASDARLVVLNGCRAGSERSRVATSHLTLAERLVREAAVPEVVAHRSPVSESDASRFAARFYQHYLRDRGGFDVSRSVHEGRKAGSEALHYSPVAISQRHVTTETLTAEP